MPRNTFASSHTAAIRRHRMMRRIIFLLLAITVGIVIFSHSRSFADAGELDGARVAVHDVYDGDTIAIRTPSGNLEKVRLKGIDAPELARGEVATAHYAWESKRYLFARIDARHVTIRFDGTQRRDRYGRLLAFIYLADNECINLEMVEQGYAYADRRFGSFMRSQLTQAEGEARRKQRGLWKDISESQMPAWRQEWLKKRRDEKPL